MDYFGDSVERRLSPRTVEVTDNERTRMDPRSSNNQIVVFVNEPEIFEDYRKMKKRHQITSSESDSSVSYKDVMQFLIQVDARLKEQEGRRINQHSNENVKLMNILRDFRRRDEGEYIDDDSEIEEHSNRVNKEESSIERPPEKRMKKVSAERFPKKRVKVGRFAPRYDAPLKKLNFIRTPKPLIGKQGIYEDK
ncbi:uncharacterized protein LOC133532691 [Cydia pomonella]|uniref:uncharacterized protein LOC133532691 n=1 Tax=Cydia pomonella TaxID=82600 RepID=UPI002ADE718C|nr:uncharacterized protein LOC133532691 [Cydia pomonella]